MMMKKVTSIIGNKALLFAVIIACPVFICQTIAANFETEKSLWPGNAAAWQSGEETPPAVNFGEKIVFECPFPSDLARHYWDAELDLDLKKCAGLELSYTLQNSAAFQGVTLYLKSGNGWYVAALPVREGYQRHWLPLSDFEKLDSPAGWNQITGVRLSPWSAKHGVGSLTLHTIQAKAAHIAIARPGGMIFREYAEQQFGAQAADRLGKQLSVLGQSFAVLNDEDLLSFAQIQNYKVIILPSHPTLPPGISQNLKRFIKNEGKLFVCYCGDSQLGQAMGVALGAYAAATKKGQWHSMNFIRSEIRIGPERVYQSTQNNLIPATPASGDTRVIAWWENERQQKQPEAACLASSAGIWIPHTLNDDDTPGLRWMLVSLLDQYLPGLYLDSAQKHAADTLAKTSQHTFLNKKTQSLVKQLQKALTDVSAEKTLQLTDSLALELNRFSDIAPKLANGWRGIWIGAEMAAANWKHLARDLADAGLTDIFLFVPRGESPSETTLDALKKNKLRTHLWHICWTLDGEEPATIRSFQQNNRLQKSVYGGNAMWRCPSRTSNREEELKRLEELSDTPAISGIHLDYIRYPDENYCYCQNCKRMFEQSIGQKNINPWPQIAHEGELAKQFKIWRTKQITDFVKAASRRLRERHPQLKLSAAVFPLYPESLNSQGQDWKLWLEKGWLDFVCPMNYTESLGEFDRWTKTQISMLNHKNLLAPGIDAVKLVSSDLIPDNLLQAEIALKEGAGGYVFFVLNHGVQRELLPVLKQLKLLRPQPLPSNKVVINSEN